jgi:NAD+ kinase
MRIHFFGSAKPAARQAIQQLIDRYGQNEMTDAECIVAIGGDGTTLKALHAVLAMPSKPVFAMRLPESAGALGNPFSLSSLPDRVEAARKISVLPLKALVGRVSGEVDTVFGINEVVVSRQLLQTAKLCVRPDKTEQGQHVIGDGLLISTPIGSTGYNRSAGGPTLKSNSQLLAVTGIAVRQPSDWSSTVLRDRVTIEIEVMDPIYRPVRVETTVQEVRQASWVKISCSHDNALTLLLEDRRGKWSRRTDSG